MIHLSPLLFSSSLHSDISVSYFSVSGSDRGKLSSAKCSFKNAALIVRHSCLLIGWRWCHPVPYTTVDNLLDADVLQSAVPGGVFCCLSSSTCLLFYWCRLASTLINTQQVNCLRDYCGKTGKRKKKKKCPYRKVCSFQTSASCIYRMNGIKCAECKVKVKLRAWQVILNLALTVSKSKQPRSMQSCVKSALKRVVKALLPHTCVRAKCLWCSVTWRRLSPCSDRQLNSDFGTCTAYMHREVCQKGSQGIRLNLGSHWMRQQSGRFFIFVQAWSQMRLLQRSKDQLISFIHP